MYQLFSLNRSLHGTGPRISRAGVLTRVVTLLATVALGAATLFRLSSEYRMPVCILVSVAAVMLVVRSLATGRALWAVPFLGVLGIFTPFRGGQFSGVHTSMLDLATLALFAVSPMMFRMSPPLAVASMPQGKL